MQTKRVFISGKVQGVYFRDNTRNRALELGVSGWVRNLPDGRVEALFQGENENIKEMVEWCWKGSPMSKVETVQVKTLPSNKKYEGFDIKE